MRQNGKLRQSIELKDLHQICILGEGGFGKVALVNNGTQEICLFRPRNNTYPLKLTIEYAQLIKYI